jgi:dihydroneopterin aldolase
MSSEEQQPITIAIDGIEVYAIHGMLPEEKEKRQLFLFDIKLELPSCPACASDNIEDSVDYAGVIEIVREVAWGGSYELLERLASVTAEEILARFEAVASVRITVEKDDPPVEYPVGGISISLERERP